MTRPPRLDLLDHLLFLSLYRLRTTGPHLCKRVVDRQHECDRIGYRTEHGNSSDGAKLPDSEIRGIVCGGAEESAGADGCAEEEGLLLFVK